MKRYLSQQFLRGYRIFMKGIRVNASLSALVGGDHCGRGTVAVTNGGRSACGYIRIHDTCKWRFWRTPTSMDESSCIYGFIFSLTHSLYVKTCWLLLLELATITLSTLHNWFAQLTIICLYAILFCDVVFQPRAQIIYWRVVTLCFWFVMLFKIGRLFGSPKSVTLFTYTYTS